MKLLVQAVPCQALQHACRLWLVCEYDTAVVVLLVVPAHQLLLRVAHLAAAAAAGASHTDSKQEFQRQQCSRKCVL